MSRHRESTSYGHSISFLGGGDYRLHWAVDRHYAGSRLRFPRTCHRDTDEAGAIRFALKWEVTRMPKGLRAVMPATRPAKENEGHG